MQTPLGVDKEVESYDVTVETTNRDGTPSADHLVVFSDLDEFRFFDAFAAQGVQVVRVPKGRYGVFAWVFAGEESAAMLTDTELVVDHALTLTVDARKAAPVRVTAPQAGAGTLLATVNADWTTENAGISASLLMPTFDGLYSGRLSDVSKPFFLGSVNGSFADPGPDQTFRNSPYTVDLAYFSPGAGFNGLVKAPRLKDLATLRTSFATEATGAEGVKGNMASYAENSGGWMVLVPFDLPMRRTEYLSVEAPWTGEFMQETRPASDDEFPETLSDNTTGRDTFRAGRTYRQDWNRSVVGPNVTRPPFEAYWVTRQGDQLYAFVPMFGDGAGHPGASTVESESMALYRGATKIGDGPVFDLPPGTATYRLEASATRGAPHTLSTEVRGVWTFRSGHVGGAAFQRLPLLTVRFAPRLDDANRAPAGRSFEIPVVVEHQPDAAVGRVRSMRVEVSYDDGRTWQRATLRGEGDHRTAVVRHPRGAGFASLRVTAADTRGNSVTQTVIRAYALG